MAYKRTQFGLFLEKILAMDSKHNMCSREYDWEEIEKSLISNGSW